MNPDIYKVSINNGMMEESFLDEGSALGFAEEWWMRGYEATVLKNGETWSDYEH